jgi:hypothetical protein
MTWTTRKRYLKTHAAEIHRTDRARALSRRDPDVCTTNGYSDVAQIYGFAQ